MNNQAVSAGLINLLNKALARELQVSVQYMMQHALWAGRVSAGLDKSANAKQVKYIASHALYFLPVATLKRVAITEMRHAESIAERIVVLGGEPETQPVAFQMGETSTETLEINRKMEEGAIALYEQIIKTAGNEDDEKTVKMFQWILSDEVKHHQEFSEILGEG